MFFRRAPKVSGPLSRNSALRFDDHHETTEQSELPDVRVRLTVVRPVVAGTPPPIAAPDGVVQSLEIGAGLELRGHRYSDLRGKPNKSDRRKPARCRQEKSKYTQEKSRNTA